MYDVIAIHYKMITVTINDLIIKQLRNVMLKCETRGFLYIVLLLLYTMKKII